VLLPAAGEGFFFQEGEPFYIFEKGLCGAAAFIVVCSLGITSLAEKQKRK